MIRKKIAFLFLLTACILSGVNSQHLENSHSTYLFKQNKGQWNSNVLFKTNLTDGAMFLEKQGITYHFQDKTWLRESHGKGNIPRPDSIHGHVVRVSFNGSNPCPTISQNKKAPYYENYFIGDDSSKWAANVGIYNEVTYSEIYKHIDFKIYESQTNMKYDFVIKPGGKTKDIEIEYKGADEMFIENGILYVKTSMTDIIENKPFSYQVINGKTITVPSQFKLKKNKVSFVFPEGYDKNYELVIDPFLIFSTYSGSNADNFGFTATYDTLGFTYAGGIVFGTGYPLTTGAYDTSFNGGTNSLGLRPADIGISKFSQNGAALIYSTYLGGAGDEAPHSLVTNDRGELFILGTTSSSNFPTTIGCYDATFGGGTNVSLNGLDFTTGTDIIVAKLNNTGSILLASTYIGGTANDGLNTVIGLTNNYADEFRGEIIVDAADNCFIATTTNSTNFPTIGGLTSRGGSSDGVVFKFNPTLTTLLWSTHIGGSGNDAAYGIQQDAAGNTFVVGGTTSTNLTLAQNTNSGGIDGYIIKYSPTNLLLTSRYVGTSSYDQIYLVQIDVTDSVYIYGQSLGNMPVTPGKYNNPGTHQFIQKYNNNINTLDFSTVIGSSTTTSDISPTAFLVNDCGLIYLSGWGGNLFSGATLSTSGLPVTPGAYQTSTTGNDFYLMMLEENATGLNYATFFGGAVEREHVDGGTSRFDKKGNVYQAVCTGCYSSDFPTTPGAWSTTNGSTRCNLGVFKFNINEIKASASVPSATICFPSVAIFGNTSQNGNTYFWDFGDGTTSSDFAPSHTYLAAGTYNVVLTVSDSTGCILPDTANIYINVFDPASAAITADTNICEGTSIQLNASGGTNYLWSPASTLSNANIPNPIASPLFPTRYRVIVTNPCGADTSFVNIGFHATSTNTSNDTTICAGDTAQLWATGGGTYSWSPSSSMINPNSASPRVFPSISTQYRVSVISPEGCPISDSLTITVINIPQPNLTSDDSICYGESKLLIASGADSYFWGVSSDLSNSIGTTNTATPLSTTKFYVDFINKCATITDSVIITVIIPQAISSPDDTICSNEPTQLWASGGISYSWSPRNLVFTPNRDTTLANPKSPTVFSVIVTDRMGCRDTAYTRINFSPLPMVNAGTNQVINFGESVTLSATSSNGTFYWSPNTSLSSTSSKTPLAQPSNTTSYIANLLDDYGCIVSDTVVISLNGSLYAPNSFSPNGDGVNDVFKITSEDITKFEILIFNRWGEKIFESTDVNFEWDGTHKGSLSKIDTYVWKIIYSDVNTPNREIIGHVNIVR
jgi:gliding motility-associated-like protein